MGKRKSGIGRHPGRKRSCKQKAVSATSATAESMERARSEKAIQQKLIERRQRRLVLLPVHDQNGNGDNDENKTDKIWRRNFDRSRPLRAMQRTTVRQSTATGKQSKYWRTTWLQRSKIQLLEKELATLKKQLNVAKQAVAEERENTERERRLKNHPDWPTPYNGITAVRHGDIDRDVRLYLAKSEQRSCALAAGTVVEGILCMAAGGYLVEQLPGVDPGVDPETVRIVERNLARLVERDDEATNDYGDENGQLGGGGGWNAVPTGLLRSGKTPVDIAAAILDGL